ncbi:hypothetical protein [Albidovulum sp.]|jgi:hypothetical protein|uniref:hypothetical protein n=1 Tax=Albidovulum sp. TaxID=1872424 RepID=UPI00306D3097
MPLNETPISDALARAAERWQLAFVVGTKVPLSQLADLAARRGSEAVPPQAMPNPFRPRRA